MGTIARREWLHSPQYCTIPHMTTDSEDIYRRPVRGDRVRRLPSGRLPSRMPIDGAQVRIEPLDPAMHKSELYQASHGTAEALHIWDYLPWGPWTAEDDFGSWLRALAGSPDFIWYAFRTRHDGRAKGMACYFDIVAEQGVMEIGGIWFSPDMQRTRAATETLFVMMSYAMDELRYRRLQWRCNALNERSRRAARRLGFRFEGIFYNHMIVKGRNRDTAWYAITDDDWPALSAIYRKWLSDDNFDQDGVARSSLSALTRNK